MSAPEEQPSITLYGNVTLVILPYMLIVSVTSVILPYMAVLPYMDINGTLSPHLMRGTECPPRVSSLSSAPTPFSFGTTMA